MKYRITRAGDDPEAWHITLPDRFDFAAARHFLRQIKNFHSTELPDKLHLDCGNTRYIDTAGLGGLLLLGEHVGANRTIVLEKASGTVRGLLDIARIEQRLAGTLPLHEEYDLRACARCGHTANGHCAGTPLAAAGCTEAALAV
ncbi:STAS domain-containing protein [Azonexus sp.]|uniref:STAS domain-containing protein n=1 Tax=Azonexus sp. TaxID=1872668 RepID=UPI0035B1B891